MAIASDNKFPKVIITEGSAPSSPAAGDQKLFIDSADHKLKRKNSAGTVTTIEGGSVATDAIWDTKGDIAVATGADTASKLAAGSNGQVLTADSTQSTGLKWAAGASGSVATDTIFDAKGDLPVGTGADTAAKLAAGSNGQVLTADSTQSTGLKWATPSAGASSAALAYSAYTYINNASSGVITIPAGAAVGDYAFLFVTHAYPPSATPTGWIPITTINPSWSNVNVAAYYRKIQSGDASSNVTVNFGGAGYGHLTMGIVSGAVTLRDVALEQSGASVTTSTPAALRTVSGDLLLFSGGWRVGSVSLTPNIGSNAITRNDANWSSALASATAAGGPTQCGFTSGTSGAEGVVVVCVG